MAWAPSVLATSNANRNTSNPTIALTTGSSDTLLVVGVYVDDTSEGDVSSVSDGDGDTYTSAHTFTSGNQKLHIFYVDGPTQSSSKTITANTTASCDTVLSAASFTGTPDSASLIGDVGDGSSSSSSSVTTGTGGSSLVAVNADSLVIAVFGQDTNSSTAGSTWGTGQTLVGDANNGGAEKFYGAMTYEILTASGTNEQSGTFSKSGNNVVAAVEFKHAAAAQRRIFIV